MKVYLNIILENPIEALDKFHKEKKNIDSFLLDFKKEVIASQTAIWKELHNVKNILSSKPGSKIIFKN